MKASVELDVRRSAPKGASRRSSVLSPRVQVSEMQRARLLAAATVIFAELGYASASVAHITARARVSRRTFYDLFASREECLIGVMEGALGRVVGEVAAADLEGLGWCERVRGGLFVILSFLDREPLLARVCVVQALQGGPRVLVWRDGVLQRLSEVLDQGRGESARARACTVLTAEGLVGAAFAIVYARLSARSGASQEPLRGLLGELMSMIVLPYLGADAARREQRRALPLLLPRAGRAMRTDEGRQWGVVIEQDLLRDIPMRLTYRTARVLQAAAEYPGASNRAIGEAADTHDQGQISKLLTRLERLGLIENTSGNHHRPTGEPNAWRLTALGERVTAQLNLTGDLGREAA